MRKNAEKVITAFANGKPAVGDSKKTISTDGLAIYSYKMKIAERIDNNTVMLVPYNSGPSRTTRSQIRACEILLPKFYKVIQEPLDSKPKDVLDVGDLVKTNPNMIASHKGKHVALYTNETNEIRWVNSTIFEGQIGEIFKYGHQLATWWPTLNGYNYWHLLKELILVHKRK